LQANLFLHGFFLARERVSIMKLKAFHAGDGDCLLLSTDDSQHHMLIDGGRKGTFSAHTRPLLAALNDELDVVCVSHIDNDHIAGILQLVEDEVEWRVFAFRHSLDPNANPPAIPRPPRIGQIWHNALFRLVGNDLAPQIESVLASVAGVLAGSESEKAFDLATTYENLITGEEAALELSRRISDEQLNIPTNVPADGGLMQRGQPGDTFQLGNLKLFILGPSPDDLDALREEWQGWLNRHQADLAELQRRLLEDERNLGTLSPMMVANPLTTSLGEGLASVTPPNLASLMILIEDGPQTLLLTGDGVSSEILEGLAHHGKLDAEGKIHVTVLKVQHHGALANVTAEFVEKVTADHYIFCGNGAHHNPEIEVVQAFAEAHQASLDTPYKFWFTSSSETEGLSDDRKKHMTLLQTEVATLIQHSNGLMQVQFMAAGHFDVL
jgi:beta-lactamase superfamily II metal-dependent hydrolase